MAGFMRFAEVVAGIATCPPAQAYIASQAYHHHASCSRPPMEETSVHLRKESSTDMIKAD